MLHSIAKIFSKRFIALPAIFIFGFLLSFQAAEAKSYSYDLIDVKININQDSTFDAEEQQTFNYIGEYHSGWRSILLNKTDGISDIEVVDGQTGQKLAYSRKRLDKLDSASWGRFTYFKENGAENIEWYYNLADTTYKWIIKYKVHGGIGFFPDYDELYWNVFTDYEMPVKEATAQIMLPEEVNYSNVIFKAYRTDVYQEYFIDKSPLPDKKSFLFEAKNFKSKEAFTVQLDWPKGIVSQSAYWQDFLRIYLFYLLAGLITFANLIFIFVHWYWREVRPKGRGTIIPQYAPPENLRPAMAEILIKERVTDKGWSATVIDLAVRGYVRIKEDTADWMDTARNIFPIIPIILILLIFITQIVRFSAYKNFWFAVSFGGIFMWLIFMFVKPLWALLKNGLKDFFVPKNYILEEVEDADRSSLEDYEILFLSVIFGETKTFSTKAMKHASNARKRELFEAMEKLKEKLYSETTIDTGAFEIGVEKEKTGCGILAVAFIAVILIFAFFQTIVASFAIFLGAVFLNGILIYIYLNYEARLSKKGFILKEDWLGFKMYLETAERYRMQNLTPETFEKYLPYAIIFGIEKKWGKAFEASNIQNPSWYIGVYVGGGIHSGGFSQGGGFSPAGFSASFSSSFSSAFSSAGGVGSAGGGGGGGAGSAGGGGGGGGAG
ncbi:MAG: DUF2207 domain-containing protein [bacterium]|nr:DUF2207 domain-containing protein [bacterium]